MTIKRFEELEIWQEARELCKKVRELVKQTTLVKDFSLKNQILASSDSVMDNIAEGFERDGKKEFLNFLYYAKGSLGEARSQLYRCSDAGYLGQEEFQNLIEKCIHLSVKIKNFINYLDSTNFEGHKKKNLQ